MLYLTCTMISNVDLACYGVSRAKDRVSVDYGTSKGLIFCCLAFDVCSDVKYFYVGVSVCIEDKDVTAHTQNTQLRNEILST